jgi:hypothetical protein
MANAVPDPPIATHRQPDPAGLLGGPAVLARESGGS